MYSVRNRQNQLITHHTVVEHAKFGLGRVIALADNVHFGVMAQVVFDGGLRRAGVPIPVSELYMSLNIIKEKETVLDVFDYGSRVYGTENIESDYDYIFLVEGQSGDKYQVSHDGIEITVYDQKAFYDAWQAHEISVLEALSWKHKHAIPYIDKNKLRSSISKTASNSWVKAKKKIEQGDIYIGKKSLFHAIRILDFGTQLADYGYVAQFTNLQHYYEHIMNLKGDWDAHHALFKPIYNQYHTTFKESAPKETDRKWQIRFNEFNQQ